jgi:hypothetical protein
VPARGRIRSAPGQLWASCWPVLRPVREVRSLDWDRRARVTPAEERKVSAPRLGRAFKDRTSRHVPGSLAWSCARGANAPTARAAVERRQAACSVEHAPRPSPPAPDSGGQRTRRGGWTARLSAFRLLYLLFVARMERSVIREWHSSSLIVPGFRFAPSGLLGLQNSGATKRAAGMVSLIRPRAAGEGDHAKHGGGGED